MLPKCHWAWAIDERSLGLFWRNRHSGRKHEVWGHKVTRERTSCPQIFLYYLSAQKFLAARPSIDNLYITCRFVHTSTSKPTNSLNLEQGEERRT